MHHHEQQLQHVHSNITAKDVLAKVEQIISIGKQINNSPETIVNQIRTAILHNLS
jgi:hypothetical protein